ncbi:hypothetical protein GCM10011487_28880 [Steroidobacter agaridevorans]|uniref:DUF4124 domain-containing protein n=1 Tax=Steroidobacter agaridevorans TaxID=2695856 RepID=A0A829YDH9_9GAMM|nr:hypothetical protein [Steroidobacter agaridevorans]GFE80888.1 hypothetical protein GCM10011487_28880 [Steroidobacter agaridevorans]GFE89228.1 hypothetical protein GCM10011488_41820 [Steroidobacter agaridevorans]
MRGIRTLTVVVAIVASGVAFAAQKQQKKSNPTDEAYFRCKDVNGQQLFSDSMPMGCQGQDTEVLNAHGSVLRVIEGDRTRAARLAREAGESLERKQKQERELRDRMLLETYLSVEDIERLRDQRLEMLVAQHRATEQTIVNMRERQSRLETQIARFKPYSTKPGAPPLPDHLAEEMVNTVNSMKVYEESLEKNLVEQTEIEASFSADIKRFKELKGIK